MLDENLPTFYLARSQEQPEHLATYYLRRNGQDPEPAYSVHHPEPSNPNSKNCYAVAFFDPYNPSVLFGEVFLRPKWSHPTSTQANGVPPPPEPILPEEFVVQLYDPDMQVRVVYHSGSLVGNPHWDFSVPQDTFRTPSGSQLDRSQHDPAATTTTPKLNFRWKRESKLTKEMTCYMTGKSTDVLGKKKGRDPDITIALFQRLKEVTIYEPNLSRVDIEDPKGLEVVLMLAVTTIKDVYFGNLRQAFNISDTERRSNNARPPTTSHNRPSMDSGRPHAHSVGAMPMNGRQGPPPQPPRPAQGPPITDARTQWEIDAETQRLQAAEQAEQSEIKRREDAVRRARERADEEETKRLRRMVEEEAKEAKKRQKEVDKETERLQKLYGVPSGGRQNLAASIASSGPMQPPPRPHSAQPYAQPGSSLGPPQYPQYPRPQSTYQQPPYAGSSSSVNTGSMMSGALQNSGLAGRKPKKSFWNLRNPESEDRGRIQRKRSSVW